MPYPTRQYRQTQPTFVRKKINKDKPTHPTVSRLNRQNDPFFITQELVIPLSHLPTLANERLQPLELLYPQCTVDITQPIVITYPAMRKPTGTDITTLISKSRTTISDFLVIRQQYPTLAGGHLLVRVERERTDITQRTHLRPVHLAAQRLAGILNTPQATLLSQLPHLIDARRVPEYLDRQQGLGLVGNFAGDTRHVDIVGTRIYVNENRSRIDHQHGIRRGDKAEWRRYHLIPRTNPKRQHAQM